jgi:hypothetical protein
VLCGFESKGKELVTEIGDCRELKAMFYKTALKYWIFSEIIIFGEMAKVLTFSS